MSAAPSPRRLRRWNWITGIAPAQQRGSLILALAAGVATVFAFAPFRLALLPVVTLGVLFLLWQRATPREALRLGFAFGAGLFLAGVSWVYVALNTFGEMDAALAGLGTTLFCLYLAWFPALTGYVAARIAPPGSIARLAAAAAAWTLSEWLRSWLFSGFPWLSIGYAALPLPDSSALAGYAPLGGVWLVGGAYATIAAACAAGVDALVARRRLQVLAAGLTVVIVLGAGAALSILTFSTPVGAPLAVSLVQGNVSQDVKFDPAMRGETFRLYTDLVRQSRGRLVVLPESALPAFADEIPRNVLLDLLGVAAARQGAVMTGLFTVEPPEPGQRGLRYYNSVISLGVAEPQVYRKRHLVPFGETIPLEPIVGWFIRSVLSIPLANQSAGAADQPAFDVAGQQVAVNICYEDAFGADIRPQAAAATMLVNVTNDAWYGRSLAAEQHNQIAAMRALETARPLLRSTNTGITSVIAHDGREIARLPWFTRGTLEITIDGRRGETPYVRWGDATAVTLAFLVLAMALLAAMRTARRAVRTGDAQAAR